MKNKIITICFIAFGAFFGIEQSYACACGLPNLDAIKQQLIQYHDSGQYAKNQSAVAEKAIQYLKNRIASKQTSEKLAIVLDIDETALSNYRDMLTLRFGGTFADIVRAEGKGTDAVIKPTLELYRYAKANKIAVFFITGRTESYRDATVKNLEDVGYKNWNGLVLKSENYHEKSAAPYKINARKEIIQQGYNIVLDMGDQDSDLIGGYTEKTFKLPNPYYLIP